MKLTRLQQAAIGAAVLALVATAFVISVAPHDVVLFNHSPSVPVGLYVRVDADPVIGSFVTVRARDVAPVEAASRDYNDSQDRFIKRVVAAGGQMVCSDGVQISIDGVTAARRFQRDERSAPALWSGCRRLAADEVLLLGDSEDSFDGRYWGPISVDLVEGVWRPL